MHLRSKPPNRVPISRPEPGGFSLIEVVLALGIVSAGLIAMVGLLSLGLRTFHEGINETVSAQIAQGLINNIQQTDFNDVENLGIDYYFDEQGNELEEADRAKAVYQVKAWVNHYPTMLPGTTGNFNLMTVRVQVVRYPGNLPLNWNAPPAGAYVANYFTQVAKS